MKLPISIAVRLHRMMMGERVPSSELKHAEVQKMFEEGVLHKVQSGRRNAVVFISDVQQVKAYLHNHYGIADIEEYTRRYWATDLSRSEAVVLASDSKLRAVRTFKGFLVNSYTSVEATLNSEAFIVRPQKGSFIFITDYENFLPHPAVTVVGIENAENFANIYLQRHLFQAIQPLFICRYPQSNDLVKWLQSIPNTYLHFGDLDFEGINIYLNEYKKNLGDRASFFIPPNTEELLTKYGNRDLYNRQLNRLVNKDQIEELAIHELVALFHKHKRVLEQEIFIKA